MLLTLNADDNIFLPLQQTMQRHGLQARSTIETTYSSTICCLAAKGTGIGVINPYVANKFASELAIRPLLPQCAVEIALALPLHRAPSARADVFVQHLQA